MLSRHSVGTYQGNEPKNNLSGNTPPQSSQLAEPLWVYRGLKSGISVHELISTSKKKKKKSTSREWIDKLSRQVLTSQEKSYQPSPVKIPSTGSHTIVWTHENTAAQVFGDGKVTHAIRPLINRCTPSIKKTNTEAEKENTQQQQQKSGPWLPVFQSTGCPLTSVWRSSPCLCACVWPAGRRGQWRQRWRRWMGGSALCSSTSSTFPRSLTQPPHQTPPSSSETVHNEIISRNFHCKYGTSNENVPVSLPDWATLCINWNRDAFKQQIFGFIALVKCGVILVQAFRRTATIFGLPALTQRQGRA